MYAPYWAYMNIMEKKMETTVVESQASERPEHSISLTGNTRANYWKSIVGGSPYEERIVLCGASCCGPPQYGNPCITVENTALLRKLD